MTEATTSWTVMREDGRTITFATEPREDVPHHCAQHGWFSSELCPICEDHRRLDAHVEAHKRKDTKRYEEATDATS